MEEYQLIRQMIREDSTMSVEEIRQIASALNAQPRGVQGLNQGLLGFLIASFVGIAMIATLVSTSADSSDLRKTNHRPAEHPGLHLRLLLRSTHGADVDRTGDPATGGPARGGRQRFGRRERCGCSRRLDVVRRQDRRRPSERDQRSCGALSRVTSRRVTSRRVTSRRVTSRRVTSRRVTSRWVTSRWVTSHRMICTTLTVRTATSRGMAFLSGRLGEVEPPRRVRRLQSLRRMGSWVIVGGSTRGSFGSGRCGWSARSAPIMSRSGRR